MKPFLILLLSVCPVGILCGQAVRMGGDQTGYIVRSPDSQGGAAWTYHGNDGSSVNGYSTPYSVTVHPSSYQPGWYETLHHSDALAAPLVQRPAQPQPSDDMSWLTETAAQTPQYYPMPYPVPVPVMKQHQRQIKQISASDTAEQAFHELFDKMTPDRKLKFGTEACADFHIPTNSGIPATVLLPYLRLWLRTHPQPDATPSKQTP